MVSLEQALFAALPPLLLVVAGAIAATFPPSAKVRSGLLHLAAGVVFAVVAVELIPDLLRDHQPVETVIGFAVGVVAMLGIRQLTESKKSADASDASLPMGMLVGVGVDLLVDGVMIGIGFAAGSKEGRMLAIALAVELVSLGLATASSLSKRGITRRRSLLALTTLGSIFLVGAAAGLFLLVRLSPHWLDIVLSFGAAALLFLVTEELLTEAHEERESPMLTAMFFLGFLAFLVVGIVG